MCISSDFPLMVPVATKVPLRHSAEPRAGTHWVGTKMMDARKKNLRNPDEERDLDQSPAHKWKKQSSRRKKNVRKEEKIRNKYIISYVLSVLTLKLWKYCWFCLILPLLNLTDLSEFTLYFVLSNGCVFLKINKNKCIFLVPCLIHPHQHCTSHVWIT